MQNCDTKLLKFLRINVTLWYYIKIADHGRLIEKHLFHHVQNVNPVARAYIRRTIYYVWIYEHKIAINQFRSVFVFSPMENGRLRAKYAKRLRGIPDFVNVPGITSDTKIRRQSHRFTMESLCTLNKYVCSRNAI